MPPVNRKHRIDSNPVSPAATSSVPGRASAAPTWQGATRWRAYLVIAPLLLLLLLWTWAFYAEGALKGGPSGKAFEADFAMFYGAAQVLKDGGNPYDHQVLLRAERRIMQRQGLRMVERKRWPVVRVGNPPAFLWLLEPLTRFRFQGVAYAWLGLMYGCAALGFIAALRFLGWRRRVLPTIIFLLMPQVVLGSFYGNPVALVFAALTVALVVARSQPLVAGLLLSAAWLKPPVALPLVLLIVLFHSTRKARVTAGFAIATALGLGITLATTGAHSLVWWEHGLTSYSADMAIQPDVASLAGLYVRWAPTSMRLALEALSLAVALALTAHAWWVFRRRDDIPMESVAWLWFVWMLATPYAHYFDEMLLAAPFLVVIGRNGAQITRAPAAVALYLSLFSLIFVEKIYFNANLLSPFLLATLGCLLWSQRTGGATRRDMPAERPVDRPALQPATESRGHAP
ncbi:MAG: hypothetical protein NVS4B2_27180 [Chloroflexota bacterium]